MTRKPRQRSDILAGAKFYARAMAQRAVSGAIPEWDDKADEANWAAMRKDIREGCIEMVQGIAVAMEFPERQKAATVRAISKVNG